jgi:poly(3-hydroxybutyrate) depolymerase
MSVPKSYSLGKKYPVVIHFHGWGGPWPSTNTQIHKLGEEHDFITVMPQGYADLNGKFVEHKINWNSGQQTDGIATADDTCMWDCGSICFDSCGGECSRCNQNTCIDDVKFVTEMIDHINQWYSIDLQSIFMQGSSNGSEFVHYFASQRPDIPRAVAPVYGLPLVGRLNVPHALSRVPINLSYDRSDTTIPWEGGVSAYSMIYESKKTVLAQWALRHQCESTGVDLVGVNTPFDGGDKNIYC